MRRTTALAAMTAVLLAGTAQAQTPLSGPPAAGHSRVLVIGVDGTRWDLLRQAMSAGQAPNLARLSREGVAGPTLLPYTPPAALTLSEVGWSTIASGAGPAKHGVNGFMLNNDPRQATKNGYSDFLTRAESVRPAVSTFLASDWANIGLAKNGGPIFGTAIDTRHALAAEDTVDSWNRGDAEVTAVAARYLRRGDPDAGFVYLGQVDEVAHLVGSATPAYRDAIALADRRIGALLDAIRARPTYGLERWTVIVTTDHGQQDLDYPSIVSHGGPSELERTSFVFAAGPGIAKLGHGRPGGGGHRADRGAPARPEGGPGVEPGRPLVRDGGAAPAPARGAGAGALQATGTGAGGGGGEGRAGAARRAPPAAARAGAEARRPCACERAPHRSRTGQGGPARAGDHAARRRQKGAGARAPAAAAAQAPALGARVRDRGRRRGARAPDRGDPAAVGSRP